MLYKKIMIEVLGKYLQFAKVLRDIYFQAGHCRELDAGVRHRIDSKLFLDKWNKRNT